MNKVKNAIVLHLYYTDLWDEFKQLIEPILELGNCELYVTIVDESFKEEIQKVTSNVYVVENRGLDIGPFIKMMDIIDNKEYNAIFKIHSKKSIHNNPQGNQWRKTLVNSIIGSVDLYNQISNIIQKEPNTICGSGEWFYTFNRDMVNIPYHYKVIKDTIEQLNLDIVEQKIGNSICFGNNGSFFAGTMFATSHKYIKSIFKNCNKTDLYNTLPLGYVANSNAHAMERIFGFYLPKQGNYVLINKSI